MTVLYNLRDLRIGMDAIQQTRGQFDWVHNGEPFRVVFIIDDIETPSGMLLFFTHRSGRLSFEKPVIELSGGRYAITDNFFDDPDTWAALKRLFYRDGSSGREMTPKGFFEDLNKATPQSPRVLKRVEPHEGPRRDVEEEDKIYFCGWRTYQPGGRRPTTANLNKTRAKCGKVAYERCVKSQMSSCWTDIAERAVPYYDPPEEP